MGRPSPVLAGLLTAPPGSLLALYPTTAQRPGASAATSHTPAGGSPLIEGVCVFHRPFPIVSGKVPLLHRSLLYKDSYL